MRILKFCLFVPFMLMFSCLGCAKASNGFVTITPQEAKKLMETEKNYVIVDVREQAEYAEGHIPNALLLPLGTIEQDAEKALPDKKQLLLVHCRSGKRSKIAAQKLVTKGYSNVKDFGGLLDWPYEIVK